MKMRIRLPIIKISKYKSIVLLISLYIFTYGVWIEIMGINNPYRYLIYMIVLALIPVGFIRYRQTNGLSSIVFISCFIWVYFFLYYGINHYGSILGIYNYCFIPMVILGMIGLFITNHSEIRHKLIKSYFDLSCIFGILGAMATAYESITHRYILQSGSFNSLTYAFSSVTRANGLIGSPLINGTMFGYLAITALFLFFSTGKSRYFVLVGIFIVSLVLTMSRGPLVSAAIGSFVFFFLKEKNKNRKILFLLGSSIVILIALEVLLNIQTTNSTIIRIQSIFNWTSESGNVTRISVWTSLFCLLKGHAFWGMGIGSLDFYQIPVTESGWLYVLFETGIVGLIVYLLPIVLAIKKTLYWLKKRYRLIFAYCVSVLTMILIENTVLQVLTSLIVQIVFGITIALIFSHVIEEQLHDRQSKLLEN